MATSLDITKIEERVHMKKYIGRLAPSPSGLLHVGHAQTFYHAMKRAYKDINGELILRIEDLDKPRCKPEYLHQMIEDMKWLGIRWTHGPHLHDVSCGAEYIQSNRMHHYTSYWHKLLLSGYIYPCKHSRKDVERALSAPHEGEEEIIFPTSLRPSYMIYDDIIHDANDDVNDPIINSKYYHHTSSYAYNRLPDDIKMMLTPSTKINWRFRVPDGKIISYHDHHYGRKQYMAGIDFGDFIIWRADGIPSYDFACVVDDILMNVTEVVRGEDLLLSTAKQLLLYYALGTNDVNVPEFYHCSLVRDDNGKRLAKRDDAKSLKSIREDGITPESIINGFDIVT